MKKLSEVCKLVGVTRRTLQEYDRINLLKPSAKTEAGYWLYDEEAISRLYLIRIFIRVGYTRNEIARIINNPSLDFIEECQTAIFKLMEERKEIDGMINMLRMNMIWTRLMPSDISKSLTDLDIEDILGKKSFAEHIDEYINKLKDIDNLENEEKQSFVVAGAMFQGIAMFRKYDVSSEEVQNYIRDIYNFLIELMISSDKDFMNEDIDFINSVKENNEIISQTISQIVLLLKGQEYEEKLDATYGDGASAFIREALEFFVMSKGGSLNE